jgi:hypothetical protein
VFGESPVSVPVETVLETETDVKGAEKLGLVEAFTMYPDEGEVEPQTTVAEVVSIAVTVGVNGAGTPKNQLMVLPPSTDVTPAKMANPPPA